MKDLLTKIRTSLGMEWGQFADLLHISTNAVQKWENGEIVPSFAVQKQIHRICKKEKLNLLGEIVPSRPEDNSVLYHASKSGIIGDIKPISRNKCDFGSGFYMGTEPLQPLTLVCNERSPVFYTLSFDMSELKVLYVGAGIEWAMLIAYYRGYMDYAVGTPVYDHYAHLADGYDVISGCIANDRMYQVLPNFFDGNITDTALLGSLSALQLGYQYVAISPNACTKIQILEERPLHPLELLILRDTSAARRKEGLTLADRIVREHRRDGRYFDEIMEGKIT